MKKVIFVLIGLCTALPVLPAGAAGQKPAVTSIVRRGDSLAVIVRFNSDLQSSTRMSLGTFRLLDVTDGKLVALADSSDVSQETCPRNVENRVCIPLAAGEPKLDDTHEYVLRLPPIKLISGTLPAAPHTILPVAGKVTGERAVLDSAQNKQYVFATYTRSLLRDTVADPQIRVNGRLVRILNPRSGTQPLCFRPSESDFSCNIDKLVRNGDVISFRLVNRRDTTKVIDGPFSAHTAERLPAEKEADARFRLKASYSRVSGEKTGTLAALLRDCRLPTIGLVCPEVHFGGINQPLEGWIRPYVDLLLTTEENGRYDLGLQLQSYLYDVPVFNMIDLRVTPRRESDQKGTLSHWMYVDAEARLYLRGVQSGPVLGGFYNLIPRVGYERGSTDESPDDPRIEANDPERWKVGAQLVVSWPENSLNFLRKGGRLTADWTGYDIQRDPDYADPPDDWLHHFRVEATFNVARNLGISVTRRTGRQGPTFTHINTLELGFAYLQ
jgi:hypothetical protein